MFMWFAFAGLPITLMVRHLSGSFLRQELSRLLGKIRLLPLWLVILIGATAILIGLMAVVTPPMNFDVQIYHLPREIFWMMQGSVTPFSATHTHQISMPVLAEYLGLNLLLLSGTDALHNLIQTIFMASACGLISLIVSDLGGCARAQGLAVLTMLLTPAAFFEASNSKNDIILSLFVLFPLATGLRLWLHRSEPTFPILFAASLSAGLSLATKGTAVVYLFPSAILIVAACLRQHSGRTLLMAIVPGLLLVLLPPLPQMMRNQALFHSAAGPNLHHANLHHDPGAILNVIIRNIAGQFTGNSAPWNRYLESSTRSLLESLSLNPDDPSTTFEGQTFHLPYFAGLEDIVPAPVQTMLLLLCPLSLFFSPLRRRPGRIALFACSYGALLLFCLLFRWQPWQSRLLIPGYFMAAPLIGIMLDQLRPTWLVLVMTFAELLSLRPHLIYAGQRPLLGNNSIFRMSRDEQMSRMMPGRAIELRTLISILSKSPPSAIQIDGGATEI